jgi:hypothetical protein
MDGDVFELGQKVFITNYGLYDAFLELEIIDIIEEKPLGCSYGTGYKQTYYICSRGYGSERLTAKDIHKTKEQAIKYSEANRINEISEVKYQIERLSGRLKWLESFKF